MTSTSPLQVKWNKMISEKCPSLYGSLHHWIVGHIHKNITFFEILSVCFNYFVQRLWREINGFYKLRSNQQIVHYRIDYIYATKHQSRFWHQYFHQPCANTMDTKGSPVTVILRIGFLVKKQYSKKVVKLRRPYFSIKGIPEVSLLHLQ